MTPSLTVKTIRVANGYLLINHDSELEYGVYFEKPAALVEAVAIMAQNWVDYE
jgi:hypothetical protein